jgi:DNA-binding CsgD family transcriptional regulator
LSRSSDLALVRDLCRSGIDLIAQMPVLSPALRRLVPAFSLSMIRVDERGAPQEHYSEYFDEFSHRLFASAGPAFAERSDDPAAFGNLLRRPQAFGNLIELPPGYQQGATYQHLFQRNGIHHCMDLALRDPGRWLGILGIFRERAAPAFNQRDLATVDQLYPWLVHAAIAKPLPADFDAHDSALLIATLDGKVQWASATARAWLEDAAGLSAERLPLLDQGLLPLAIRHLCHAWNAGREAGTSGTSGLPPPMLSFPVPGGRLRLRAYGLDSQWPGQPVTANLIGIQLELEMHRGLRVLHSLSQAPLTPQQRRIGYAIWQGKSAAEIRTQLGLSATTLKAYQQDLCGRLGLAGIGELKPLLDRQAQATTLDLQHHRPRGR